MVLVVPGLRAKTARVLLLAGGQIGVVGEVRVDAPAHELASITKNALDAAATAPLLQDPSVMIDTLAVVTRWLYSPSTRRRGSATRITDQTEIRGLTVGIAAAAESFKRTKPLNIADQSVEA